MIIEYDTIADILTIQSQTPFIDYSSLKWSNDKRMVNTSLGDEYDYSFKEMDNIDDKCMEVFNSISSLLNMLK